MMLMSAQNLEGIKEVVTHDVDECPKSGGNQGSGHS